MKFIRLLLRNRFSLLVLLALIFSSCQAGLIHTGNNGLQINLQGFPKALLSTGNLPGATASRGLLTNGGSVHITIINADGSGTTFFDQDVTVVLVNGVPIAKATITGIPINTLVQISARVTDGNGAVMFSAVSQVALNALASQQLTLSVVPNTKYRNISPVAKSGMPSITLYSGQSAILAVNPGASQINLPFVLSWATMANAPSFSIADSSGAEIAATPIENGKSGLRFIPTSANTYYIVVGNGGQNRMNLIYLSGFSGEKLVYTNPGTNTITIPTNLSSAASITGFAWGAGGSGAKYLYKNVWSYGYGGGGGYATVDFTASQGNTVIVVVGEQGHYQSGATMKLPAAGGTSTSQGSGGGASLVIYSTKASNALYATAGGGGGGSAGMDRTQGVGHYGGAGGGASGIADESGAAYPGSGSYGGSNQTSAGENMARSINANLPLINFGGAGGSSSTSGGGGGGFGGGSGGDLANYYSYSGGAGGGGMSLSGNTNAGSGIYPANTKDPDYGVDNAGIGGDGSAAIPDGYPGRVVLYVYY